jgi:thiol:disulfide interchange protein DsbD
MSILKFSLFLSLLYLSVIPFLFSAQLHSQFKGAAKARIVSNGYSAGKDSSIQIGVLIELAKGWHIYWKNPGDSGIPTSIEWDVPTEFQVTQFQWPIPKSFEFDGLVSYGYEDQVLFITDIFLPNDDKTQIINISAKIKSLLCRDICIPFDTLINFTINVQEDYSADGTTKKLFEQTEKSLPTKADSKGLSAEIISEQIYLRIDKSSDYYLQNSSMNFIPYENGLFKNTLSQNLVRENNYIELILESDPFRIKVPKELYGLLISNTNTNGSISSKAVEIKIPISE